MLKKSKGNMYSWVTHTHCHLGGECPHRCSYCYVDNPRFGRPDRYKGSLRLIEDEFKVNYGSGKTIFLENCNDMFAEDVPKEFIERILSHCAKSPNNRYVFQTKNPARYAKFMPLFAENLPNVTLGTTIESNRWYPTIMKKAPPPSRRAEAMMGGCPYGYQKFVTLEPILDFDVDVMTSWLTYIAPDFVNIGADSKKHNLPEPSIEKINELILKLKGEGINSIEKHNLKRITEKGKTR